MRCSTRGNTAASTTPYSMGCTAVLDTRLTTERAETAPKSEFGESPGITKYPAMSTLV